MKPRPNTREFSAVRVQVLLACERVAKRAQIEPLDEDLPIGWFKSRHVTAESHTLAQETLEAEGAPKGARARGPSLIHVNKKLAQLVAKGYLEVQDLPRSDIGAKGYRLLPGYEELLYEEYRGVLLPITPSDRHLAAILVAALQQLPADEQQRVIAAATPEPKRRPKASTA